jgi:predicted TPR repeat methyltransferase
MPDFAAAHFSRGLIVRHQDREAALNSFGRALDYDPFFTKTYEILGELLISMGRSEEAVGVYRRWLEVEPANPIAQHMYAAAAGDKVPERCATQYVAAVFDDFAGRFDEVLEGLGYSSPQLLAAALARRVDFGQGRHDVLDAGCGTGLCGPLLRSTARVLTGVDLSSQMLAKARARGVYDELIEAELGAFMESRPQRFDIVNCADTLVYIGALEQVMAAAHRCLRPKGVFGFTVEALPEGTGSPFKLTPQGRYAHSSRYLRDIMASAGFSEVECQSIDLRKESSATVRGYLFIASVAA